MVFAFFRAVASLVGPRCGRRPIETSRAAAIIGLTLGAGCAPVRLISPTVCDGQWSTPVPIQRADGRPVYIERGVITPFGDRTLALGSPTFLWLARNELAPRDSMADTMKFRWSMTRPGALIDAGGTATVVPSVDSPVVHRTPSLVAQDAHSVLIAWGVVGDHRIDLASFDGRHWSTPTTITTAEQLELQPATATRPGRRLSSPLIVATGHDSAGPFIRLAQQDGARWTTTDWRDHIFTVAAAAASRWADGSITLVVMGSSLPHTPGGELARPSVYAVRGEPDGAAYKWHPPQIIDSLRASYSPFSSARLGGDSLVVVWYGPRVSGGQGVLNTALSIDRGQTWRLTAPIIPQSKMDGSALAVDARGGLHVIFRGAVGPQAHAMNAPGVIVHSAWRSGEWSTPIAVSKELSVTAPAIGPLVDAGLIVMWATADVTPTGLTPKSFASFWSPRCAPR